MALLFNQFFSSVALGHFIVDVLNGQRGILFAYLSKQLGFSNTTLGLVTTIYLMVAAVSQPFFGHLADRHGPRWVLSSGILWMGAFFTVALVISGWPAVILLIVASIGSGAFHPAGAMQATLMGRNNLDGQEATAASYFFVFGQIGFFVGPLLGGPLLDRFGSAGITALSFLALPVGLYALFVFRVSGSQTAEPKPDLKPTLQTQNRRIGAGILAAFIVTASFQSWAQVNMITFVPKYLSDLGQPAGVYAFISALFMGGSAVGNLFGGGLADRVGKPQVVLGSMVLGSVPLFIITWSGFSPWLYLLVPMAGALSGAAYTVNVVIAQNLIPGGMGLASGLALGFIFGAGALGASISGLVADAAGFQAVFALTGAITLAGGLAAFALIDRSSI